MSRYYLSRHASADLDEIRGYLDHIPEKYAAPIRHGLRDLLNEIGLHPGRGANHSGAIRVLGEEVKSRTVPPYRMFYRDSRGTPEVFAILHGARDIEAILSQRLQ